MNKQCTRNGLRIVYEAIENKLRSERLQGRGHSSAVPYIRNNLQLIKTLWVTGKTKCNSPSGIRIGLEMVVGIHYTMS
uniref:Reverse transcriptase n=1 Tax=Heterorhabditis bacteriophora TaxID=37862 RepID=A0A1I7WIE6_HETBA